MDQFKRIIISALAEDIGQGDITTALLVSRTATSRARLILKEKGVVCGLDLARRVFKHLDPNIRFRALLRDGDIGRKNLIIAELSGKTRALLSGERVAINLLSLMSGIATQTRRYVARIKPYKAKIMDTRKTTPLLRSIERYAVRCGGGVNHRFNLNAMVLIKDNHRAVLKRRDMSVAVEELKKQTKTKVEVEVDSLAQFKEILPSKADIILLDNMTPRQTAAAVRLRDQARSRVLLEASGGITLKNVRRFAASGVERISVGALTHSRHALDISLEFLPSP